MKRPVLMHRIDADLPIGPTSAQLRVPGSIFGTSAPVFRRPTDLRPRKLIRMRFAPAVLLLALPEAALAGDLDRDTSSRHDRAASRASSSSSSSSSDDDDDDDDTSYGSSDTSAYGDDDFDYDDSVYYVPAPPPDPVPGELALASAFLYDRMAGIAGGEVVHQDGIGFSAAAELTFFSAGDHVDDRFGISSFASYARTWMLTDFRPQGASYTSDLALDAVEFDVGPHWLLRRGGIEFRYGLGFGFTLLRSDERFSDGLTLQELLALGLRTRSYVSFAPATESRPFIDLGLVFFLGHVTKYLEDYDSLIDGLGAVMATPYARTGYLYAVSDSVHIGFAYELGVVGTVWANPSLTHRAQLVVKLSSEDGLSGRSAER